MSQEFRALSHCQTKRNGPDLYSKIQMQFDNDQRKLTLKASIVWSLSGVLNDNNFLLLGSWTFFKYEAIVPEYLPVNPCLPDYKESLDFFLEVFDELEKGDSLLKIVRNSLQK